MAGLRHEIGTLRNQFYSEFHEIRTDLRHLAQIQQRQGQMMLAGSITIFAAILATGSLRCSSPGDADLLDLPDRLPVVTPAGSLAHLDDARVDRG